MAKSKWEQLHAKMNTIMQGIEQKIQMIKECVSNYNQFEMHFHRELLNPDQLPSNASKYMEIANTHCIFLKTLCSDENLKKEFQKPFLKYPHFYLPLRSIPGTTLTFKKIVRWYVSLEFAPGIISKLHDLPLEFLLYCPAYGEYEDIKKWFPHKDKMLSMYIEGLKEEIILSNLGEPVNNLFSNFLKNQNFVEDSKHPLPYSPSIGANIKTALEKVLECKKNRKFGPYDLFQQWEKQLLYYVFKGTGWPEEKQKASLLRIKAFRKYKSEFHKPDLSSTKTAGEIFNKVLKSEVVCFDKRTIAMIIQYFFKKFNRDHNDKKSGQIVCILWLLIWLSHETSDGIVALEKIIHLSSKEINLKNKSLTIYKKEIKVSRGLMSLLLILIGKGKGIRCCRLFPDINKRNFKYALEKAFKELFPHEALFFSLSSLLVFPHEFSGVKIPASLLKKMKNLDAYAGKPGDLKVSILKGFKS